MSIARGFLTFLLDIIKSRKVLWALAINDFKSRFLTSFLGIIWAFVQPLVTILVFWYVFQVGFKSSPINDVPFIVWFAPSYLIWAYFAECLGASTNSLREYGYLVKKVNFRVSMIPLFKIISSSFVHAAFILLIIFMLIYYRIGLSIYNLQAIYYFICTVLLLVGLGWFLSAISAFSGDVANVVNVFIQIGFWMTPIFWSPDTMAPIVQQVLKLNPMFYVCRGYRDAFIDYVWFWQRGYTNLFFWVVTISLFFIGAIVFKKLRPHFADVL